MSGRMNGLSVHFSVQRASDGFHLQQFGFPGETPVKKGWRCSSELLKRTS